MSIRTPVAMACSVVALSYAGTSFADDSTTPWYEEGSAEQPSQPGSSQRSTQQQSAASAAQQPGSTTTTTSAPYVYASGRPVERTTERLPNGDMLSTGVGLFILSYGASVVAAAESTRDADKRLFVPVVGPWMNLNDRGCTRANPCGAGEGMARALIVTSGIVQGFGALLTLGSLVIPESVTVEEKTTTAKAAPPKPEVRITPMSFGAGAGVGAVGRF